MKRIAAPELLDDDLGACEEVASSLGDLKRINTWFGGTRTTTGALRQVAREAGLDRLHLLEVGAGGGDAPRQARRALAREGIRLEITLLDRKASHLPPDGAAAVAGEALRLPFADGSFDVVGSNLFLHHFDPHGLLQVTREALRVARVAVLVNDLVRSRLHLLLTYLGLPLFRSRLTWHDAPASVRQAYTVAEMRNILNQLELRKLDISTHYLFRMAVLLWK
jgi:ubiquinone/menaquinone biosynthesis C-methylase UbiE